MNRVLLAAGLALVALAGDDRATSSLTVTGEVPEVAMTFVPGGDVQAGGPVHDFRISTFEIRNDQFAAFLNDARDNTDNPRGSNMFFDPDNRNVHVGTSSAGTIMFRMVLEEEGGQLEFVDGAYVAVEGFADHPVASVSWYGAVKYCNWLTIDGELGEGARAYTEGSSASEWHPVTIAEEDWATRDLNDEEREQLIAEQLGYRLPMDDSANGASLYNEWYKVAASRLDGETVVFDRLYGFGRSTIEDVDANHIDSGDPFEPGTSPAGFFDGANLMGDGETPTRDTENAYGLYDLSGNVWEWMQDQRGSDPLQRRTRGGSWANATFLLRVNQAVSLAAADTDAGRGFRIVQSVPDGFLLTPTASTITGPWGGPYDPAATKILSIENVTDLDGVQFTAEVVDALPWLTLDVDPEQVIEINAGQRASVQADVIVVCGDVLTVGDHQATVLVTRLEGGTQAESIITLIVTEPLSVSPPDAYSPSAQFASTNAPPAKTYTLTSASDTVVQWSATVQYDPEGGEWLTVPTTGEVPPGPDGVDIEFAVDAAVTATLPAGERRATVTVVDDCTGTTFDREVVLTVGDPFDVDRAAGVSFRGLLGGPIAPDDELLTITSETDTPIEWSVSVDYGEGETAWVTLDISGGTLDPETPVEVLAGIADAGLPVAAHEATLHFIDGTLEETTGFDIGRGVSIEIVDYVAPADDVDIVGPEGGPFEPASLMYTLENIEPFAEVFVIIEVQYGPGAADWLDVPDDLFFLADPPDDTANVEIVLNASTKGIPARPEPYLVTLRFHRPDLTDVFVERVISLTVESASTAFVLSMSNVPVDDVQDNGPTHHFRIGTHEVNNREFARFLTDAFAQPDDERGSYVYFDTDSGSAYIGDQPIGQRGAGPPNGEVTLLYDATIGRLSFDGEVFKAATQDAWLPVVGVSWYGAAKFCNWLTVAQGMDTSERAYTEGPDADSWVPVIFDPNDFESSRVGFRLPRDDGADTASEFNEWYKAASHEGGGVFDAVYGYGRDNEPTSGDANYQPSGDPFDEVAPVGFYGAGGSRQWDDPKFGWGESPPETFDVIDTSNGYALYDMCGNVAEWVHERSGTDGATRGGHFANAASDVALRTDHRTERPANATLSFVGFRVAQSYDPTELTVVQDDDQVRARGPVGGPYTFDNQDDTFTIRLVNDGRYTIDNLSVVFSPVNRVEIVSPPIRQIAPGREATITLGVVDSLDDVGVPAPPPDGLVLVPGSDVQTDGPMHDYWISPIEVRNDQFVAFLNNARENLDNAKGHYLYFDTDDGAVYVNDEMIGAEGTGPPEGVVVPIYDPAVGAITYADGLYAVDDALKLRPVVGVSWFGAVKYCNWLTIFAELPESLRAYAEAPADRANDWGPVSADPSVQIARTLGYRLPGDGGVGGVNAWGEWYKAAAQAGSDETGEPVYGALFGYGRDEVPTSIDANYLDSDDPFDDVTPTGFYGIDGDRSFDDPNFGWTESPPETFTVADTSNGYGLYDLCGNVAEWVQDLFDAGDSSTRTVRGGSWADAAESPVLRSDQRTALLATTVNARTGFRVVRGTGHVVTITITDDVADMSHDAAIIIDLTPPWAIAPRAEVAWSGMYGDTFEGSLSDDYVLTNVSATVIDWTVDVVIENGGDWVEADPTEGALDEAGGPNPDEVVTLAASAIADALAPGDYSATATFEARHGETLVYSESREVSLTVDEPVSVTPEDALELSCISGQCTDVEIEEFLFEKLSEMDLDYAVSATSSDGWLAVEAVPPGEGLEGTFPAGGVVSFAPSVGAEADALDCDEYTGTLSFAFIDRNNEDLTSVTERAFTLTVLDTLEIVGDDPAEVPLDRKNLPVIDYELVNHDESPVGVAVVILESGVDWLDIADANPTLPPGTTPWSVSINEIALDLPDGKHEATLEFTNALSGCVQTRTITLTVSETLTVLPATGLSAGGIEGVGPFSPGRKVYTLSNAMDGGDALDWEVVRSDQDATWLLIDGGNSAQGTLEDGEERRVVLSINEDRAIERSEEGSPYELEVLFKQRGGVETMFASRSISLIIARPQFPIVDSIVSIAADQPGGPDHSFRISTYPVTNDEYAAFLNDALTHLDDSKGAHMFFDTETLPGNVYINDDPLGAQGAGPPDGTVVLLYEATNGESPVGRIEWDGAGFAVEAGFENHPVVGMTWYGAVKYCNWLSLDQGIVPDARAYTEDVNNNLQGWHPASTTSEDWAARDLNPQERLALVTDYRGYRLPMDQGYNNPSPDPPSETADTYNEWYKGGAWNPATGANTLYGFGRNAIDGADANYRNNGDPFDNGTTPVGYFDGSDYGGEFATTASENGFGLLDMTGNVSEWVQGHFNTTLPLFRTIRGGSWNQVVSLMDVRSRGAKLATSTSTRVGFRVVRATPPASGDADGDGLIGLSDFVLFFDCLEGPAEAADGVCTIFDFDGSETIDLADFVAFQALFNEAP